jgi:hypothetical protein
MIRFEKSPFFGERQKSLILARGSESEAAETLSWLVPAERLHFEDWS